MKRGNAALSMALALCAVLAARASASVPAILYSPDAVVDADPSLNYAEPTIAADPTRSQVLVAAVESGTFSGVNVYRSDDGGYDWQPASLPMAGVQTIGDVQLAAGTQNLYFASLGYEKGIERSGIQFYTSTDHGDTFAHTAFVHTWHSYDHEQLTVDAGMDRFRGRIYMSALYSIQLKPQVNTCGLVWSDSAHAFHGPVPVVKGWCFNSKPVVLANGNILFPYIYSAKFGQFTQKIEVAISSDGGRTFGPPHQVGTYAALRPAAFISRLRSGAFDFDGDPIPQYAAYQNAVYAVWSDMATGTDRLLLSRSSDGGMRWSPPRVIVPPPDAADAQYQVAIAVNDRGVVGLSFLRADEAAKTVSEMFSVSTDGGRTFTSPLAIESTPARLDAMQNGGYGASMDRIQGTVLVGFVTPGARFPSGGDYVGMAVDRSGAFHPIWVDARTGADQAWTATARLGGATAAPAMLHAANVSGEVNLEFGAGSWDVTTHTFAVPVRLHNVGTRPLYPPFTVTVTMMHDPYAAKQFQQYYPSPIITNADNGKSGVGATFVYGPAELGNLGVLAPGAESAARIWRVRIPWASVSADMVTRIAANAGK